MLQMLYFQYFPLMPKQHSQSDIFLITAHELRTSLAAMKWLFGMLLDGDYGALSDEQRVLLIKASVGNEHMLSLLNDTLTVMRSDKAVSMYTFSPVDLSALTLECVEAFYAEAHAQDMDIRFEKGAVPIIVSADAMRLRIVIHNLIENAIKYGNPETDIVVSFSHTDTIVTLNVQDHGIGIPVQDQSYMFGRFFRASNTAAHPGVGLGLYASKQIVEAHGGTIAFTSSPAGTLFSCSLPRIAS